MFKALNLSNTIAKYLKYYIALFNIVSAFSIDNNTYCVIYIITKLMPSCTKSSCSKSYF
jgi:hypothetical protein